jgi:hypothetical protein
MKLHSFILVSLLAGISVAKGQSTVTFQPAALPGGGKIIYTWSEQGLMFTPSAHLTSNDIFDEGYPYNGGAYIQNIGFPQTLTITSIDAQPFSVFSVDLAEYSTDPPITPVGVTFLGEYLDGSTVDITFTTDGIIDGNGPLPDFETFYFPTSFSGLRKLTLQSTSFDAYSMDNLQAEVIPEPSVISLISFAFVFWIVACKNQSPPPDKMLQNSLKQNGSRQQFIELLPRRGGGWCANRQRIGND